MRSSLAPSERSDKSMTMSAAVSNEGGVSGGPAARSAASASASSSSACSAFSASSSVTAHAAANTASMRAESVLSTSTIVQASPPISAAARSCAAMTAASTPAAFFSDARLYLCPDQCALSQCRLSGSSVPVVAQRTLPPGSSSASECVARKSASSRASSSAASRFHASAGVGPRSLCRTPTSP